MLQREDLLATPVLHFDIKACNPTALINGMRHTRHIGRDLAKAASLYHRMLSDRNCGIVLCMASPLVSSGLKQVFVDLIRNRMVDAIVSIGANIVDQDFFEALGFHHYLPEDSDSEVCDESTLKELHIDRVCDTLIDNEDWQHCDDAIHLIADALPGGTYSSREFIREMGMYLAEQHRARLVEQDEDSIVMAAFEEDVPIFCPAFSDCSAGFGLSAHQQSRGDRDKVSIDSGKDFYELTRLKIASGETGLVILGSNPPACEAPYLEKAAASLGQETAAHNFALRLDAAVLQGEAASKDPWNRCDALESQHVACDPTFATPLVTGYAYHSGIWKTRKARRWTRLLESALAPS